MPARKHAIRFGSSNKNRLILKLPEYLKIPAILVSPDFFTARTSCMKSLQASHPFYLSHYISDGRPHLFKTSQSLLAICKLAACNHGDSRRMNFPTCRVLAKQQDWRLGMEVTFVEVRREEVSKLVGLFQRPDLHYEHSSGLLCFRLMQLADALLSRTACISVCHVARFWQLI